MAQCEIGIQFWPWHPVKTLVRYAEDAMQAAAFDQIWLADEFQYEDPFTVLTALAMRLDVAVGTLVTFPHRNPLELAQRFASIAGLMPAGREVSAGIGAGGAVQEQVVRDKAAPVALMDETVRFLQGMLSGEPVPLSAFPRLSQRFRYNPRSHARLDFPPPSAVPVYVAAGGPRMFDLAGRVGDGIVYSQTSPWSSIPGVERGLLHQAAEMVANGRRTAGRTGRFKTIYTLLISVAEDGDRARQWAKRNTSYTLAGCYGRYPQYLEASGIPLGPELAAIREAYVLGLGVDEGARRVSDALLDCCGFVSAGTPREVIAKCEPLLAQLRQFGVDHLVIGVPLGPDVPEALRLIARDLVPAFRRLMD